MTLRTLTILMALIGASTASGAPISGAEELSGVRLTPAIPGGVRFDGTVDLPAETPEPSAIVLLAAAASTTLGRGRHGRRLA